MFTIVELGQYAYTDVITPKFNKSLRLRKIILAWKKQKTYKQVIASKDSRTVSEKHILFCTRSSRLPFKIHYFMRK